MSMPISNHSFCPEQIFVKLLHGNVVHKSEFWTRQQLKGGHSIRVVIQYSHVLVTVYGSVSAGREKWPFNVLFLAPQVL